MVPDLYLEAFQIVLAAHNDAVAGVYFPNTVTGKQ